MGCTSSKSKDVVETGANKSANDENKKANLPSPYPEKVAANSEIAVVKEEGGRSISSQACFGAGCYWGTEKFFFHMFGTKTDQGGSILKGKVGFMGPKDAPANPTYKEVCSGYTGHVEVYNCEYTGGADYYEKLVRFFFQFHDPTTHRRQGNDVGSQYASVIYCYDTAQSAIANKVKDELQALLDKGELSYAYQERKIMTEIRDATTFYPAHTEHQDYLSVNPGGYCNHRIRFSKWPEPAVGPAPGSDGSDTATGAGTGVSVDAVQAEVTAQ